jgi:hypothetical protein
MNGAMKGWPYKYGCNTHGAAGLGFMNTVKRRIARKKAARLQRRKNRT